MVTQLDGPGCGPELGCEIVCTVKQCTLSTARLGTRGVRIKKTGMFLVLLDLTFW